MRITPILAENQGVFRRFIQEQNLNTGHFAYIHNQNTIRGQRGLILSIGRWWRNPYYDSEFHEQLENYLHVGIVSIVKGSNDSETY